MVGMKAEGSFGVRGFPMRNLIAAVERIDPLTVSGRVAAVSGLLIECRGGLTRLSIGARAEIERPQGGPLPAEVVGFRDTRALLMPFGPVEGVAPGAEIKIRPEGAMVRPTLAWRGRIVNAFGEPIDGKGPLPQGPTPYALRAPPPPAHSRGRVGERLDLGVRAMDVFTTCCRGQRLGVFAGSGVGKSVLLSMLAREATCDSVVVGLIGERGREVREFVEETLGEAGLRRAIVVVATSDEPALTRRQAAYMTLALAEYLRDQVGNIFGGVISGVTEWGMYVEIIENKCEGMIRLRDISDDFYTLDEKNYAIIGQRKKKVYQLGDEVKIRVKNVDLTKKQIDFSLVQE